VAYFAAGYLASEPQPLSQPHIERTAVVSYVIDGDTIALQGGEHVRLTGVDTPELRSANPVDKARAHEAKRFVENLCPPGKEIGLDVDGLRPKDRRSRTLAVVYVQADNSWIHVNAELIRKGFAEVLFVPPSEFNPYKWLN